MLAQVVARIGDNHHQPAWWRTAMWSDVRTQLRLRRIDQKNEAARAPAGQGGGEHSFGRPPDLRLLPRIDDA